MHYRTLASVLSLALLITGASRLLGAEAVQVGKGSYASEPPAGAGDGLGKIESQPLYLVKDDGRPLPTNKYWSQLLVAKFAKSLWSLPLKLDTSEKGIDLFFPTHWRPDGNDPDSDAPLHIGGDDFTPADSRAKDWSDWMVSFRLGQTPQKYLDVTLVQGMPTIWLECHGVSPVLSYPANEKPAYFALNVSHGLPATGDCVGVRYAGRSFGVFAPDGSRFREGPKGLVIEFPPGQSYLAISALLADKDLAFFHRYAYAIPRKTEFSWKYDAAKGLVHTMWHVETEPLKGREKQVVQGWLPHHYRDSANDLKLEPLSYLSPRGALCCAIGNDFALDYSFAGILPNLPAPTDVAGANAFQPARMHEYLRQVAGGEKFGADTYWGGKDIQRCGQCALMAQQLHDPLYADFVSALGGAMRDWFTYRPGKAERYFCYYPKFKALVGVHPSYGSEGFNDHHFHYGYYTFASALLAMHDPQFAKDYGPMATLVAKEYANWDRKDQRFPFLRTFDVWSGHGWASGTSSPGGANQESSSEAIQAWAGLVYLGQALGDQEMIATGAMGYSIETRAVLDYWFNQGGKQFSPQYKHKAVGMVWSGGNGYGTWFSGDPAWIYGIQWLPASPMLSYLVHDPKLARERFEQMASEAKGHPITSQDIKAWGPALGSVMLGYVLMYDPKWVCQQLDELWAEPGDTVAHNAGEMTVMYYQAHAMRSLGQIDWSLRADSPTAVAYLGPATKQSSYVAWNPTGEAQTVTFYRDEKPVGTMLAPARQLTRVHELK